MEEKKFALLIDADNISAKYTKTILEELTKYGKVTYKRVYGDMTKPTNKGWKDAILENSINPMQQYNYTQGKNSTDSAMIIDAMDILYSGSVDGFCLATSDSDFTRLASRLRESGMMVIGMGERKTPEPFRISCERFFFLDILSDDSINDGSDKNESAEGVTPLPVIESYVKRIIIENGNESNSMDIGELGSKLTKLDPAFDTRNYGYTKFSKFLQQFKSINLVNKDNAVTAYLTDNGISTDLVEKEILTILSTADKYTMNTGLLNQKLLAMDPTFDVTNYGYNKFSKLLSDFDTLSVSPFGRTVTVVDEKAMKAVLEANKPTVNGRKIASRNNTNTSPKRIRQSSKKA